MKEHGVTQHNLNDYKYFFKRLTTNHSKTVMDFDIFLEAMSCMFADKSQVIDKFNLSDDYVPGPDFNKFGMRIRSNKKRTKGLTSSLPPLNRNDSDDEVLLHSKQLGKLKEGEYVGPQD